METGTLTAQSIVTALLRESLARKVRANPSYSARAFARDIAVSPAFVSMLLNGKKRLSLDRAQGIADALEMEPKERGRFLRSVALASISSKGSAKHLSFLLNNSAETQDVFPVDVDRFQFFSNWYHVAVLDLLACQDFKADLLWIAHRLEVSPAVVRSALDRLQRLGLIEKKDGTYIKTNGHISVPGRQPDPSIRNFHSQMIDKAREALSSADPSDFPFREISSITMSADPSKLGEAKKLVAEFKRKMADLMADGEITEVYQFNVQLFPLTKVRKDRTQ